MCIVYIWLCLCIILYFGFKFLDVYLVIYYILCLNHYTLYSHWIILIFQFLYLVGNNSLISILYNYNPSFLSDSSTYFPCAELEKSRPVSLRPKTTPNLIKNTLYTMSHIQSVCHCKILWFQTSPDLILPSLILKWDHRTYDITKNWIFPGKVHSNAGHCFI